MNAYNLKQVRYRDINREGVWCDEQKMKQDVLKIVICTVFLLRKSVHMGNGDDNPVFLQKSTRILWGGVD